MTTPREINEIIECLKLTYTSSDMKTRLQAEEKLLEYETNIIPYIKTFIQLIATDLTLDFKAKLAVVLQLKRAISKYINTQVSINKKDVIEIIKVFAEALLSSVIEPKLKKSLAEPFQFLLNFLEESPDILLQFTIYLCQSLNSTNLPQELFEGVLSIFSSIVLSTSFLKQNDLEIIKHILPITKRIIQVSYQNIQGMEDIEQEKRQLLISNKVIEGAYGIFISASFKLKAKGSPESRKFLDKSSEEAMVLGIKILFAVIANYIPYPPICWTFSSEIDSSFNKMKSQILRFICLITANLSNTISDQQTFNLHLEMLKRIAMNLEYIVLNKYKELHLMEKKNDHMYILFIAQMLQFISKALSKKTLRNEFKEFEKDFFKNILLPLLVITQGEINESKTNPGDYSVILEDAMFNHTNKTIKSAACQLMKTLITREAEEFISQYIMELFNSVLGSNSNGTHHSQLMTVNDFIVKISLSKEMRLDLCLLVFSILEGHFSNEQIEIDFCVRMNENFPLLFSEQADEYIKHKLCIVLAKYFSVFQSIDDDNNSITIACIHYLFHNVFLENNPLVAEEATQALNKIIEQSKSIYKLHRPLINHVFVEIIKIIPKTIILNVFDVIYQIRANTEPSELDLQLFITLCNRVSVEAAHQSRLKFKVQTINEEEQGARLKNKPSNELFITKCFNIIRYLVDEEKFVVKNLETIETHLKPLFYYIKNPLNIDFDEDIILIMSNLIKYTKRIPSIGEELLPELHKYAKKNEGMLNDLFELINLYLVFGSSTIEQNEEYCQGILNVFKYGSNDDKFNESPFYVALLIHLWLLASKTIPSQVVIQLLINSITAIVSIYSWVEDPMKVAELSEGKYNFIGCLMVIYSSFVNYSSIIIKLLTESNQLLQLIQWTEYCLTLKVISYPIKMIIFALSRMINQDYFINDNAHFINLCLRLLINQQNYESLKLKSIVDQKEMKRYDNSIEDEELDEEEEEDDDEDKENRINMETDIETLLSHFINPFTNTDEFKEFKSAMELFEGSHPQQFHQWYNTLSDFDKEKLNKMLSTVRINFSNKANVISIPRKIVKIKRNNNQ